MKKQVERGKVVPVMQAPQPPRYTGYGIMVFAIALLGITILLLNISEAKQTVQRQNLITAKVVQVYNQDVGVLHGRIAELEAKLAACQSESLP